MAGYFDLALRGIRALRGKKVALSVTLNGMSAGQLKEMKVVGRSVGAELEFNLLSRSLPFLQNADMSAMWPDWAEAGAIEKFLREDAKRPYYEVDYVSKYYRNEGLEEPACVLGYLQVFVMSNGDVMTGCYPLPAVGNVLRSSLREVLESDAYRRQAAAMVRRECPGCTCGIESSLAMKNAFASALVQVKALAQQARAVEAKYEA